MSAVAWMFDAGVYPDRMHGLPERRPAAAFQR